MSESDPFALILEASIVTDEDCTIQNMFLMIQKDAPGLPTDTLWPVNNHDIDQAWQNSFSLLKSQKSNDAFLVLKDQVDDQKKPVRWRPLFYCLKRSVFFHPCCPRCGSLLDVCEDDDLLNRAGLQPYSTSLKRYLYCPQCVESGSESEFYVHSRDASDPESVKDRKELVRNFGQCNANQYDDGNFPCPGCPEHERCYVSGDQAVSRIVSIAFYPFYMLFHKAPTLHLLDFLPLISGAGFEDPKKDLKVKGEEGRWTRLTDFEKKCSRRSLFFFDQDERRFPEVLYLKLSILTELARIVFADLGKMRYPDVCLSLDRFWVSVAEQNPMLPSFWNFSLRPLGVGLDQTGGAYLPKLPPNYGLYVLGFIWFYVLLFNKRNPVPMINEKVAEALEKISSEAGATLDGPLIKDPEGVFEPANIFWDPEPEVIPPAWQALWADALDLGLRLLAGSRSDPSAWSEFDFERQLEDLREKARKALFTTGPAPETPLIETDQGIHGILSEIYDKWFRARKRVPSQAEKPSSETPPNDVDLMDDIVQETVILKPGEFEGEAFDVNGSETVVEADLEPPVEPAQGPEFPGPAASDKDDIPETVIVSPGSLQEEETQGPGAAEDEVPETIIVSAEKVSKVHAGGDDQPGDRGDAGGREGDTFAEKQSNGHGKQSGEEEEDPDVVPETIIIRPGKGKT